MCLVLTLCFTSMTRTFCSPVAGCEVSSLFLYDFNVTLRNNNHMYVWIYFSCFNPFCFNGDTLLFPLFHLFNSLLNKTDRHDITEILLKVALKTTDCHDITEILLKVALKTTDCHDITEILLKVALKTTDCHDITEILLKVALKTITPFLKTLLLPIVLSVLLRFTDDDYPFGFLCPFCCLSFFTDDYPFGFFKLFLIYIFINSVDQIIQTKCI